MPPFLLKIDKKGMKMSEIKLTAKEIYKQIYNLSQIKKIDQAEVVEAFKNTVTKLITETYDEEADLEFILIKKMTILQLLIIIKLSLAIQ